MFLFILKSCKQHTARLKCILEIIKIFGVTRGEPRSCLLNGSAAGWPFTFFCLSMLCSIKDFTFISFCDPGQREELSSNPGLESCLNWKASWVWQQGFSSVPSCLTMLGTSLPVTAQSRMIWYFLRPTSVFSCIILSVSYSSPPSAPSGWTQCRMKPWYVRPGALWQIPLTQVCSPVLHLLLHVSFHWLCSLILH